MASDLPVAHFEGRGLGEGRAGDEGIAPEKGMDGIGGPGQTPPPVIFFDVLEEGELFIAGVDELPEGNRQGTDRQLSAGAAEKEKEALAILAENPEDLKALLKESLGDRAYTRIEPYIDIMISEYNDACNRHDALAAEYNALAEDNTRLVNDALDRDVDFIIVPEAFYDISANQWGAGATLGISWKNLMITAGAEKTLGMDTPWDEGYRVRLGVGISL